MKRPLFYFDWKLKFMRKHPPQRGNEAANPQRAEQHLGICENTAHFSSLWHGWSALHSPQTSLNTGARFGYTCDAASPPSSTQRRIWAQRTHLKTLNSIYFASLDSFNENLHYWSHLLVLNYIYRAGLSQKQFTNDIQSAYKYLTCIKQHQVASGDLWAPSIQRAISVSRGKPSASN